MNKKIQAILLKLTLELQRLRWTATDDWEITLQSQGFVSLSKYVEVQGDDWSDHIDTFIRLRLGSNDQITFYPEYSVEADIHIMGGDIKTIDQSTDSDVAFTERDFADSKKIMEAARKISEGAQNVVQQEYNTYLEQNHDAIQTYKSTGM